MEIASAFVSILPSMRGFGGQLQSSVSRDVDRVGRQEGSHFGKVFGVAVAAAGSAVAVGAFVKSSVSLEASFSKTLNTMAAVANVPKDQLKDLSALALKMGADTTYSANEAADAMLELAKGGISAAQIKGGALAGTLTLAAAGGTNLGTAATIASNAMNTFALKGKDMGKIAAALAGGANASSASVESLGEGLSQVGPGAKNAGLSLQQTVAALSAFDASGIKGSDAGTSLKTMLANLIPQTDKAAGAMDKLGLDFVKGNGQFESLTNIAGQLHDRLGNLSEAQRSQALTTLFGSDASRAATVLMNEGAKGIRGYIKATNDQNAAQRAADAAMKGTAGALETLGGSWETVQLQVGQLLAPVVQHGALFLAKALGQIFPAGQKAASAMAPVVSTVRSAIGDITKAFSILFEGGSMKGRIDGFAEVMDHAFGNTGALVVPIRALATTIQQFGTQAVTVFQGQVLPALRQASATFTTVVLPAIGSLVSYVVTNLWPVFLRFGQILVTNLIPIIASFVSFIYGTLYPAIVRIVTVIAMNLKPVFDQLVVTFRANVLPALQQILARFQQWQPTIQRVASVVLMLVGHVLEFAAAVLGRVLPVVIRFAGFLLSRLVPAILNTIEFVARFIGAVIKIGAAFVAAIADVAKFYIAVYKKIGQVIKAVTEIPGKVVGALGDLSRTLYNSGIALLAGFGRGIADKGRAVYDAAKGVLDKVRNLFPHSPAKEGPFSGKGWTLHSGIALMEGLADGISRSKGKVKSAIRQVLDAVKSQIQQVSSSVSQAFGGDLFSSDSASSFLANLTSTNGTIGRLKAAFATLLKWGWRPEALSALFQSGNSGLILSLASSHALATQAASQYQAVQSGLNSLGSTVANTQYSLAQDKTLHKLDDLIRAVRSVGIDVGVEINGAAKKGKKKSR